MLKSYGCLLLLIASAAHAQQPSPYSLGADVGVRSEYKLKCWSGIGCDQRAERGLRLYTAYTLGSNQLFGLRNSNALELSAFDFGTVSSVVQATPARIKTYGTALSYVSGLQLTERLSLTTKAGLSYARSTNDIDSGAQRTGLSYGLGVSYALDNNWSLHGDWTRVPVRLGADDKTRIDMYSIGLGYRF